MEVHNPQTLAEFQQLRQIGNIPFHGYKGDAYLRNRVMGRFEPLALGDLRGNNQPPLLIYLCP